MADHLFESLVLGAVGCLAILGIGRAMMLSARGVRIIAVDRERTASQGLADLGFVLCFSSGCTRWSPWAAGW